MISYLSSITYIKYKDDNEDLIGFSLKEILKDHQLLIVKIKLQLMKDLRIDSLIRQRRGYLNIPIHQLFFFYTLQSYQIIKI